MEKSPNGVNLFELTKIFFHDLWVIHKKNDDDDQVDAI